MSHSQVMRCDHCKRVSLPAFHNTIIPYCRLCFLDKAGNRIYSCSLCGLTQPAHHMETELICLDCWASLIAA
jgi:hypothetical protein